MVELASEFNLQALLGDKNLTKVEKCNQWIASRATRDGDQIIYGMPCYDRNKPPIIESTSATAKNPPAVADTATHT